MDVFPQFGVQFEIDDDIGLLAGLVDNETNTPHVSLLLLSPANCTMKSIAFKRLPG
jgi:hypothetical protein